MGKKFEKLEHRIERFTEKRKDINLFEFYPRKPVDKYKSSEKQLCKEQISLIENEVKQCSICQKSYNSYQKHGIPSSPMCKTFEDKLKNHIQNCIICSSANKKWNIDAIPITEEVREVIRLTPDKSILYNKDALFHYFESLKGFEVSKIERVQNYLLKEIEKKNAN